MRNLPRVAHLGVEPRERPSVPGKPLGEELHGDDLAKRQVLRAKDLAHSAAASERRDAVALRKDLPGSEPAAADGVRARQRIRTPGRSRIARRGRDARGLLRRGRSRRNGFAGKAAVMSTSVVPVSDSIAWPQDEQNLAFSGTLVPQAKQNIERLEVYHSFASPIECREGLRKGAPRARLCRKQELR